MIRTHIAAIEAERAKYVGMQREAEQAIEAIDKTLANLTGAPRGSASTADVIRPQGG